LVVCEAQTVIARDDVPGASLRDDRAVEAVDMHAFLERGLIAFVGVLRVNAELLERGEAVLLIDDVHWLPP
jgi:hypothetical protein